MTTFSGQSWVRGTADNCGLLRDEWGALALAETLIGQEMGSIGSQRWRAAGYGCCRLLSDFVWRRSDGVLTRKCSTPHSFAQRERPCAAVTVRGAGCQQKTPAQKICELARLKTLGIEKKNEWITPSPREYKVTKQHKT